MKKLLLIMMIGIFLVGSVSAFFLVVGITNVDVQNNKAEIDFADGTKATIMKTYQSETHERSGQSKEVKTLLIIPEISEDTQICIFRDGKYKCIR